MSESEPYDETSKASIIDIKSESCFGVRDQSGRDVEYGPDGVRCRGGMSLVQAVLRNTGTCRSNAKGETQVAKIIRVRVPMGNTGAEQAVVAVNSGNSEGAKGLRHSATVISQPSYGRSLCL